MDVLSLHQQQMNHQDPISVQTIQRHVFVDEKIRGSFGSLPPREATLQCLVLLCLIKYGKHKTGREGTCAGTGSGMALAANDGGQDCCRVSKARLSTYNHIGIVQVHAMTKP